MLAEQIVHLRFKCITGHLLPLHTGVQLLLKLGSCQYLAVIALLPSDVWSLLAFHLLSHWSVGILHIQLMVSHLATETFSTKEELDLQFFEFQLRTTRNIDSAWLMARHAHRTLYGHWK